MQPLSSGFVLALTLSAGAVTGHAATPSASASELKAAFLYNFVKFTQWPADVLPPDAPLVLCVVGDDALGDVLGAVSRGRVVGGHELDVRHLGLSDPTGDCHLAYFADADPGHARGLLQSVSSQVFTVGEGESFARSGGLVGFFVDGGQMRFAINPDAAQRAGIHLSSRLLSLARVVKEELSR